MKASRANVRVTERVISDIEQCRAWGHQWDRVGGLEKEGNARHMGYRITHRCMRCSADRIKTCNIYGQAMYTDYSYPSGWEQAREDTREGQTSRQAAKERAIRAELRDAKARGKTVPNVITKRKVHAA